MLAQTVMDSDGRTWGGTGTWGKAEAKGVMGPVGSHGQREETGTFPGSMVWRLREERFR